MTFATNRSLRHRLRGLVFVLAASTAPSAWAQAGTPTPPATSVDDRLQRGVELRKQGRDAEALDEFREAYKVDKSLRTRAQIAVAEQALGHWLEAERGLVIVLAASDDAWIDERRKALEVALDRVRSHLGWLVAESNVAGAELRVDGVKVALLPTAEPVRIVSGTHILEVTAEGATPVRRTVEVPGNGRIREAFELTVTTAPAEPKSEASPTAPPADKPKPEHSRSFSAGLVVSASAFGVLFTTGAASLVLREINVARYNDASRCVTGNLSREERCGFYRDTANTAEYIAIGALSGAALAGISAGLFFATDLSRSRRESASLRCGPRGWGVMCAGTF